MRHSHHTKQSGVATYSFRQKQATSADSGVMCRTAQRHGVNAAMVPSSFVTLLITTQLGYHGRNQDITFHPAHFLTLALRALAYYSTPDPVHACLYATNSTRLPIAHITYKIFKLPQQAPAKPRSCEDSLFQPRFPGEANQPEITANPTAPRIRGAPSSALSLEHSRKSPAHGGVRATASQSQ